MEIKKDSRFYIIMIWTILMESIIVCKYAFWMPHTLIIGSFLTVLLIGLLILQNKKMGLKEYLTNNIALTIKNISLQFVTILIIGAFIIISGVIVKDLSYIALGLVIAIIIPIFFMVTNDEDNGRYFLAEAITAGTTIVFVGFIALSIILVPLSYTQYSSIIGNPNEMGNLMILVIACLLYRLFNTKKIIYILLIAISTSFVIISISRTTYLCVIAMFFISIIYYALLNGYRRTIINTGKAILIFIITFFIVFAMLTSGNKAIRNIEKQLIGHEYIYYAKLYKYDGTELTISGLKDYIALRLGKGLPGNNEPNQTDNEENETKHTVDEESANIEENININEISSGRVNIWKEFIDELNWKGHKTGDTVYVEAVHQDGSDAHNTYLNNGYYYGYLSLISIGFYMVLMAYYHLRELIFFIKTKKENTFFLLSSLMYISFLILSMLSSVFSPYHSFIAFGFWSICLYSKSDLEYKTK